MQNLFVTATDDRTNQGAEIRPAWKAPAVNYINIKRTMSTLGGSLSDSAFQSPGLSKTSAV